MIRRMARRLKAIVKHVQDFTHWRAQGYSIRAAHSKAKVTL